MILCKCMPRFSDTYKYAFARCRVFSRLRTIWPILNLKITIILDLNELKVLFAMRGIVIIYVITWKTYVTFALRVMITVRKCLKATVRNGPSANCAIFVGISLHKRAYNNFHARFPDNPRKGNPRKELLFLPSSRVSAFSARRCDNHSTRWTIIDRRLFTLAFARSPLCVSYLQRFLEKKTFVIDRALTRKWLFLWQGI